MPALAPGAYEILHCNDPCTTTLADIAWGRMVVARPAWSYARAGVAALRGLR